MICKKSHEMVRQAMRLIFLVFTLSSSFFEIFGDTVTLKNGKKIDGTILETYEGSRIKIQTKAGMKTIMWDQIAKVNDIDESDDKASRQEIMKIERPHSIIFSGGGGFADPKGYGDSDKGKGFAAGIDYWYLYSSGDKGISFGASVRRLPFIDASTTIAGQTTKTSVTLYPVVVQLRFNILQLGAGYAPASASVTVNDKSASSAGSSGGSFVLMGGLGGGGHLTAGVALQVDLCRLYYYPDLNTYAGYFGLGIGFAWQN
ncbi:MAG: hypothetical protein KF713_09445 [Turneriella sp.]|nr:hypothetical protein [Turneriella sp.]